MKKLTLTLIAIIALSTTNITAQRVNVDKVESDGTRLLQTEYSTIYTKMMVAGAVSLFCVYDQEKADTVFYITLLLNERKPEIDKGRKLLIKLEDGSVITLENTRKIGPLDYQTREVFNTIEYIVYPQYFVSRLDLLRIINGNVVKLRIETDGADNIDRDIKKGKMSEALYYGLVNIEKALTVKKDLYSDF